MLNSTSSGCSSGFARPGLLGLVRNCLKAQWVFESGLLAVSTWADRVKRRGNGLQNRLALVKANFEDLHVPWKNPGLMWV